MPAMDIVLALHHDGAFRSFDGVVRELCDRGHRVTALIGEQDKPARQDRGLRVCADEVEGFDVEPLLTRRRWLRLAGVRELQDCAIFLKPNHPSPAIAARFRRLVRYPLRHVAKRPRLLRIAASPGVQRILRRVEPLIPPDPAVLRWLRARGPDVVVASPFILPRSGELEYAKAARILGIPTVVAVLSWDNLTTKGTFHLDPDRVFVWNRDLVREAIEIHGIAPRRLVVTGAPPFDYLFDAFAAPDRKSFCEEAGLDPDAPYVLYLGSSSFIAGDETPFVEGLVQSLRSHPGIATAQILVRPHPLNAADWRGFRADGVVVWPRDGEWVDFDAAQARLRTSLLHAAATLGVNTSAFLEAAIVDRPSVVVLTEQYRSRQTELGHFRLLLKAGFLHEARGFEEAGDVLSRLLAGDSGSFLPVIGRTTPGQLSG